MTSACCPKLKSTIDLRLDRTDASLRYLNDRLDRLNGKLNLISAEASPRVNTRNVVDLTGEQKQQQKTKNLDTASCLKKPKVVLRVHGDGDCLYHSILAAQRGSVLLPLAGNRLRRRLKIWMTSNRAFLVEEFGNPTFEQTLKRVSTPREWAENEEIQILSRMLKCCIVVHATHDGKRVSYVYAKGELMFDDNRSRCCNTSVIHIHNNGVHYNALIH